MCRQHTEHMGSFSDIFQARQGKIKVFKVGRNDFLVFHQKAHNLMCLKLKKPLFFVNNQGGDRFQGQSSHTKKPAHEAASEE